MTWVLWLLAIGVVIVTVLAALGAFGEMPEDDELAGANADHIPLALFGYRRDVVDRLLAEAKSETKDESA